MNQNRRNDVLINPLVGDFDIRMFLSFIGSDGYNPLTVATTNLKVKNGMTDVGLFFAVICRDRNESFRIRY